MISYKFRLTVILTIIYMVKMVMIKHGYSYNGYD